MSPTPCSATGVDRVVLLSPIGERLAQDQIAVIGAAEAARVERIVKISGSDWTIDPPGRSISGAAHAEVERRLAASRIASVALRPNAWMQVSLPSQIARIKAGQALVAAYGEAPVGFIDARDIADVTVQQSLAPKLVQGPLVLTGSQALSIGDIGKLASRITKRDLAVEAAPSNGIASLGFEQRAVAEFMVGAHIHQAAECCVRQGPGADRLRPRVSAAPAPARARCPGTEPAAAPARRLLRNAR